MAVCLGERALAFWRGVGESVAGDERLLLVAEAEGRIVGTVQLLLDQPPNQPHRADVAKMLVHRRARRRGIGEALMGELDRLARACGKSDLRNLEPEDLCALTVEAAAMAQVPLSGTNWIPGQGT